MAKRTSKQTTAESQAAADLIRQTLDSQAAGFQLLAGRKGKKAARQAALAARLKEELDADDPRLQAVNQTLQRSKEAALAYEQRARRLKQFATPQKNEWVISGTVVQANGRPAIGYTVDVVDLDRKYHDQLGQAQTNEYGDFQIRYLENQFDDEFYQDGPDIFVKIFDPKGKLRFESDAPLKKNAGRVEYFLIEIE